MKEALFWALVALSSVGAAIYGYHRFKLIRPDLFDDHKNAASAEAERTARIAEYQKKGDALSRAAAVTRKPRAGETCVDDVVFAIARGDASAGTKPVIENGQSVRCASTAAPAPAPAR